MKMNEKIIPFILSILLFTGCVEPVEPDFVFITELITVEGVISNEPGGSFVKFKSQNWDKFLVFIEMFL